MGQATSTNSRTPAKHSTIIKLGQLPAEDDSSSEEEIYKADNDETDEEFRTNLLPQSESADVLVQGSVQSGSREHWWSVTLQILFPFIIAGLGMVAAGIVLDIVQHWTVFVEISEIFILVPALLGLKGNLEMTLASRLSTAANLNKMDGKKEAVALIIGNLGLVQCQGIVVGFLAAITGVLLGWSTTGKIRVEHILLLSASSVVTASIASFVLGLVMIIVILASRRCRVNPDNIATPIAASLGDLTTLSLLSWIASLLWADLHKDQWLAPLIIAVYVLLIPASAYVAYRCSDTRTVLFSGWLPVLLAMLISSGGGLILNIAVVKYHGIAVFQPVMNGVGGNLVAVQASRMSTYLHLQWKGRGPGRLAEEDEVCVTPCAVVCGSEDDSRTACILLLLVLPGHALFVYAISYLEAGHTAPTLLFLFFYLLAGWLQVALLLYICRVMVYGMWRCGIDPDNSAIPYLTAIGDLLGGAFLGIAFQCLDLAGAHQFTGQLVSATLPSHNLTQVSSAELNETMLQH